MAELTTLPAPDTTEELTVVPVANPVTELPAPDVAPERASLAVRLVTFLAILVPLLGVIAAPFFLWGWGFHWTDLGLLLGMYVLTALGITVGFHRLFVHRSFETFLWVKFIWAVLGSMAVQGSLFQWVGMHRRHHQYSDTPDDPHSPQHEGHGVLGLLRGFWHAHIGWFFGPDPPDLDRYVKDLSASRTLRVASYLFPLWVALGLVLPAVLGSMAVQGSLFQWVGMHRRHHQYSDTPDDPHSPQHGGRGILGLLKGFWHAHIGWLFDAHPDLDRYVKDLWVQKRLS